MVSAIASASSSFEYSWSENKLKSGDLNSSRLSDLKCLLDDQNSCLGISFYSRWSIHRIQWKWIRRINQLNEYAIFDRKLDTSLNPNSDGKKGVFSMRDWHGLVGDYNKFQAVHHPKTYFTAPSSEMLDQTFDRLQKLVSQLELLGETISQEDVNQKLLRICHLCWNTYACCVRIKMYLDTMSMNDIYNNLKVYETEVKGMSSSSSSTQNMAFVSSSNNNNSSTNKAISTAQAVNIANGVSVANTQVNTSNIDNLSDVVICAFLASQPNNPQLAHKDLQQIYQMI
ncbi:hypothetical protein Tco_0891729 [Tanacetum coccineum]|uniref:Uncharacterized protein n=1 Tax=Tanacetum coccineum TaxID=301880 RepID=A0ABQ5C6V1_9ASTR